MLSSGRGHRLTKLGGKLRSNRDGLALIHRIIYGAGNVDNVHIRHVVQFAGARLTHSDDGQAHVLAALNLAAGIGESRLKRSGLELLGVFACQRA